MEGGEGEKNVISQVFFKNIAAIFRVSAVRQRLHSGVQEGDKS